MGRYVIFDSEVQSNIDVILEKKLDQIGLIIGQRTVQKDIAIRLCPLPQKEETAKGAQAEPAGKKSDSKLELNEAWISQFAKEVTRTLPGGFDVIGLYVVAPSTAATNYQTKLRLALYAMFKMLSRDQEHSLNSNITDKLILHICTVSLKCTCRTYDVSDIKSTPVPAEWKVNPRAPIWHTLQSRVAVDLKFAIESKDAGLSTKKQIDLSLAPFLRKIRNSIPLIDNVFRNPEDLLDSSAEGKKFKQKQKQEKCYQVDLLVPLEEIKNVHHSKTFEGIVMLTFKGTIQCRAFVHNKAIVEEAIQAIKQDVIRSITARCEIHCQDLLVIDEEQQDPVVVHELPKRVFASLPKSTILVSDYQFHSDMAADSLDAFKELLNLELTEQDIETSWELSPDTSTLIQPEANEDRLSEFGENQPAKRNIIFPVASAAIAAVAAGLSYFLLLQDH